MITKSRKIRHTMYGDESTTVYRLFGFLPIYWRASRD